jgi:alkylation response protein AidB-like acyl-CoA dehydrogenase
MAGRTQLRPGEGFGRRDVYADEHEQFRESVRRFVATEVLPRVEEWDAAGIVPREAYERAAELGFLGMAVPERHGGAGVEDFRSVVAPPAIGSTPAVQASSASTE